MSEKTQAATPKRRADSRREGTVVRSQDVDVVVVLAAGLAFLILLGPVAAQGLVGAMQDAFGRAADVRAGPEDALAHLWRPDVVLPLAALGAGLALAIAAVQLKQVGFVITLEPLAPKLERFNPVQGVQRLFSARKGVMMGLAIVKLVVIGALAASAVGTLARSPVFARPVGASELGAYLVSALWEIGWRVLLGIAAIAAADWMYQRWQYEKDLRMTRDEVRDEMRQSEGPTEAKNRMRSLARRRLFKSMRRMLEDVADSTIVITNPTHYAIALRYRRGETPAPLVLAKGRLRDARRIRARAEELGIPIVENPPLARGLYRHAEVGRAIPELYYQAVAAVLAPLYRRGLRASPPDGGRAA